MIVDEMISVIIPVYNVAGYINKCVNSVLASSYSNIEVIIVDDGSTDDSYNVCLKEKEKDDRVIVIHQENAGCTKARKNGLSIARGKYIGFVDPDDWIEPDMYEKLYYEAEQFLAELVVTVLTFHYFTPKPCW